MEECRFVPSNCSSASDSSDMEEPTCGSTFGPGKQLAVNPDEEVSCCSSSAKEDAIATGSTEASAVGTAALGFAEGLDKLFQKQRSDLLFELRKLQHGHRPVTNTDSRKNLEEFFSDALTPTDTQQPRGSQGTSSANRPHNIESEVQVLSELRPVSSVLRSQEFRHNLEDVIRGSLMRQDQDLQQALRLRSGGFVSQRVPLLPSSQDPNQQILERLSQLSYSSSSSSHPSIGLGDVAVGGPVFSPPPPPPPEPVRPWQQQQQQQQQQPWQQQQQQQAGQPPVLPQQPWLTQNSGVQLPGSGGSDVVALLRQAHREESVVEISDLVQRQLVSSTLSSNFRDTLENTMMNRLARTESDGVGVQNFVLSLQQSRRHRRNDFSHLGINPRQIRRQESRQDSGLASWAAWPALDTLRTQVSEMQTMLKLTFELQMDMQRSIRQEVAAALHSRPAPTVVQPSPVVTPSQPASEGQCVICLEKSVDAVLYQCGHMCCCLSCGLRLKGMGSHCPMCRAPIRDVIRAYRCQRD